MTEGAEGRSSFVTVKAPLAALVASALALAAPALAGSQRAHGGMTPRPMLAMDHALTIRSTVGSYCVSGRPHRHVHPATGMCADYVYPLPTRGKLPVSAGDRLTLRFRHNPRILDRVRHATVRPLRVQGQDFHAAGPAVTPRRAHGDPDRWKLRLPAEIGDANVLAVSVAYRGFGDCDFWIALTPRG